jgi:nucleotide-binding universal stress UspA family protein
MESFSVLVAIDLSENSLPAARAAAWLCRELDLSATLLYSVEPESLTTVLEYVQEGRPVTLAKWAEAKVAAIDQDLFDGVRSETRVVTATHAASEAICDVAGEVGAKLIVMGTHGRTAFEHAMFGSTATSVVRHANMDVLTVRPQLEGETDLELKLRNWVLTRGKSAAIRNVLCPVDFSVGSEEALKRAAGLAKQFEAKLLLVHAVSYPFWASREELTLAAERTREQARQSLAETEAMVRTAGVEVTSVLAEGPPWHQIVRLAKDHDTDLIVMGSHGRTGIKRWTIGSVAERTVRLSPVPVWTVSLTPSE